MTEISRRSVTRGAAWSVPVIATAAAAPAYAASGDFFVSCAAGSIANSGASTYSSVTGLPGTRHTWSMGYLTPTPPPGLGITGFRLTYPTNPIRTTNVDGTVFTATDVTGLVTTAQWGGAGVSMAPTFRTSMSYAGACLTSAQHVVKMELDFCINYLRILHAVEQASQRCCYTLTMSWNPNPANPSACWGQSGRYHVSPGSLISRPVTPR